MRTIVDIRNDIIDAQRKKTDLITDRQLNAINKEIEFYEFCERVVMYFTKEYLVKEKQRIDDLIKSKESYFDDWFKNHATKGMLRKDALTIFLRESGIDEIRQTKLKPLNYILS